MAWVVLVLGLLALGVWSGSWGFYVAAGFAATVGFFVWLIAVVVIKATKDAIKSGNFTVKK